MLKNERGIRITKELRDKIKHNASIHKMSMCEYLERITIMDNQPDIIDSERVKLLTDEQLKSHLAAYNRMVCEVQELQKGIAELQATLDCQRL
jgi:hypothetical protein